MNAIENIYSHFKIAYKVSTDSRNIENDAVFFALKGENFDGNDFAMQVAKEGKASLVVCDRDDIPALGNIIKVDDSLKALQQLALMHREKMSAKVLSITGTNGKTTTKELVSAVLSRKFDIIHTEGNFNNHIGVPLTLLRITPHTEFAIVEMGANHPKEIEALANLARPDFGIITNIGKAHLEGFGSFEGVIKTKNELYCYLKDNGGTAFVNADNKLLMDLSEHLNRHTYGENEIADFHVSQSNANPYLSVRWKDRIIQTRLVGAYNFENVAAAIAVGQFFKVSDDDITRALEAYEPTNSRSQVIQAKTNRIIMDAYNANPVSMNAAIRNFKSICGNRNALLIGDMRELGKDSETEHKAILSLLAECQFENVFLVGPCFCQYNSNNQWPCFQKVEDLCEYLVNRPIENSDILIKGSRGIRLEKALPLLS